MWFIYQGQNVQLSRRFQKTNHTVAGIGDIRFFHFALAKIDNLIKTAVADVSIATVLITHLLRSRARYESTNTGKLSAPSVCSDIKINAVIIRTIVISMETSAMTGIVATLNLVLVTVFDFISFSRWLNGFSSSYLWRTQPTSKLSYGFRCKP